MSGSIGSIGSLGSLGDLRLGDGGEVRRRGAGDLPVGPTVARGERGVVSG